MENISETILGNLWKLFDVEVENDKKNKRTDNTDDWAAYSYVLTEYSSNEREISDKLSGKFEDKSAISILIWGGFKFEEYWAMIW